MSQIDEKTVVPLGWVLGGFGALFSMGVLGALWVASVNFRLSRIEEKLGIPQFHSMESVPGITDADAKN